MCNSCRWANPVAVWLMAALCTRIFLEKPLVNILSKAVTISSIWAFAFASGAIAQEVVYIMPVPGGDTAPISDSENNSEEMRFAGSDEYEDDLRRRGLWKPRKRRGIFARSGETGIAGERVPAGNEANSSDLRRAPLSGAPVGGEVAGGNMPEIFRLRSAGQKRSAQGGGIAGALGDEAGLNMRGERRRPDEAAEMRPVRRGGEELLNNIPGEASDAGAGGPPEDFGVTARGTIDPLTGEVLPGARSLATGSAGQPPQPASSALSASALSGAVGAAGPDNTPFVEGAISTVRDRSRPYWDSLGVRVGSFIIRPSIDVASEHTDNASLSQNNRISDVRAILRPAFSADSNWLRHAMSLNLSGEIGRHARMRSEDYLQFDAALLGRIDVRRNSVIDTALGYNVSQEARNTAGGAAGSAKRPFVYVYHGSMRATQRFNRLAVSLRGSLDYSDYENNDRDYADLSLTGRLAYEIAPGMSVYGEGSYSARRHDRRFDSAGTARNSDGVSGVLGTSFELGRHVRADAALGYIARDYEDGSLKDVSAFSASADLAWNITELTTLRAGVSTSVDETTIVNASANLVREVMFGVDHELLQNFIVGAEFTLGSTRAVGNNDRDIVYSVDLNADYRLSRKAALRTNLTRTKQDSTRAGGDYTEHKLTLGLNLRM